MTHITPQSLDHNGRAAHRKLHASAQHNGHPFPTDVLQWPTITTAVPPSLLLLPEVGTLKGTGIDNGVLNVAYRMQYAHLSAHTYSYMANGTWPTACGGCIGKVEMWPRCGPFRIWETVTVRPMHRLLHYHHHHQHVDANKPPLGLSWRAFSICMRTAGPYPSRPTTMLART
ncbi:hypothetical protein AX16_002273 [Volvariella volvacea WC 439]|nr:hypothetical protein AX16_002273 [Volvariella volvacea WC 439]